jgi:hypothetical protein
MVSKRLLALPRVAVGEVEFVSMAVIVTVRLRRRLECPVCEYST